MNNIPLLFSFAFGASLNSKVCDENGKVYSLTSHGRRGIPTPLTLMTTGVNKKEVYKSTGIILNRTTFTPKDVLELMKAHQQTDDAYVIFNGSKMSRVAYLKLRGVDSAPAVTTPVAPITPATIAAPVQTQLPLTASNNADEGQFIVGTRSANNKLSFSNSPFIHKNEKLAIAEAIRLYTNNPLRDGSVFVVLKVVAAVKARVDVDVVRS